MVSQQHAGVSGPAFRSLPNCLYLPFRASVCLRACVSGGRCIHSINIPHRQLYSCSSPLTAVTRQTAEYGSVQLRPTCSRAVFCWLKISEGSYCMICRHIQSMQVMPVVVSWIDSSERCSSCRNTKTYRDCRTPEMLPVYHESAHWLLILWFAAFLASEPTNEANGNLLPA